MIKCYGTLNSLSTNFNPSVYPLTTTWQKLFLLLTKIFLSKLTQSPQSCSMQWCAGCGCGLQAAAVLHAAAAPSLHCRLYCSPCTARTRNWQLSCTATTGLENNCSVVLGLVKAVSWLVLFFSLDNVLTEQLEALKPYSLQLYLSSVCSESRGDIGQ